MLYVSQWRSNEIYYALDAWTCTLPNPGTTEWLKSSAEARRPDALRCLRTEYVDTRAHIRAHEHTNARTHTLTHSLAHSQTHTLTNTHT